MPVQYRELDDVDAMRANTLQRIREAAMKRYPIENDRYILELDGLEYDRESPATLKEQKEAIMHGKSLNHKLKGVWRLKDKATGDVVDEKKTVVAHVPMLTQRGTMIYNGNEYTCLHPSVKIWTEEGMIPIGDIVDQKLEVRVWSWNFEEGALELKPILNWFENKAKDKLVCVNFDASGRFSTTDPRFSPTTLWATPDHNLYDLAGGKFQAAEARDIVVVKEELSYSQRQLLLGTMIGDGTIYDGIYRITHCAKQGEYALLKKDILGELTFHERYVTSSKYESVRVDTRASSVFYDAAAALYAGPEGKKAIPDSWLDEIDELGLAFWIMDDGSSQYQRTTNCPDITLHTQAYEEENVDRMILWFKRRFGISPAKMRAETVYGDKTYGFTLRFTADDGWRLLELVAPYVTECMRYKLLSRPSHGECKYCGKPIDPVKSICNQCLLDNCIEKGNSISKTARYRFGTSAEVRELIASGQTPKDVFPILERWESIQKLVGTKLDSVVADNKVSYTLDTVACAVDDSGDKVYAGRKSVYDIEVADNHNYFANGVLVSNCSNQLRLRSGPYSRRKDNGGLETHFNVLPGSGRAFRVHLEPETGVFKMQVGQSHLPMYPILRAIGMNDEKLEKVWGRDLLNANKIDDPRAITKAYERFVRDKEPDETPEVGLKRAFNGFQLDDEIVESNLGSYLQPIEPMPM